VKRKGRFVLLYFRPEEEYLYERLLIFTRKTKKGRNWGISEFIKHLLMIHFNLLPSSGRESRRELNMDEKESHPDKL
jgi:hypothetical protein